MDYFDLHCDTISRLAETGGALDKAPCHVNLQKAAGFGRYSQVFALFVPDQKTPAQALGVYRTLRDTFFAQMRAFSDSVMQCRTAADLDEAFRTGRRAAILSVENGAALGGDIAVLDEFMRDGVRLLTLTWFGENELGFGSMEGGRLKPFGRQVLAALPAHGIVPDISHLSDEGVAEVFGSYEGPVVATHSNARRAAGHCRNLTARQIAEIARRGGLIGLNLCRAFLCDNEKEAGCEDVYRHIRTFLDLGARDALCFGSDFDGASVPADIADLSGVANVWEYCAKRGMDEAVLRGIFFENAAGFWRRIFP